MVDAGGAERRVERTLWRIEQSCDRRTEYHGWHRLIPGTGVKVVSPLVRFYREFTESNNIRLMMSVHQPPAPSELPLFRPWMRFRGEPEMTLNARQLPGPMLCSTCGQSIGSDHLLLKMVDQGAHLTGHLMSLLFRQPFAGHRIGVSNPLQNHDKVVRRKHCHYRSAVPAQRHICHSWCQGHHRLQVFPRADQIASVYCWATMTPGSRAARGQC